MAQWYVVREGTEQGPLSGEQLRKMAASGQLRPTDAVRREDMQTPRQASTIKGLFPDPERAPATPPSTSSTTAPRSSTEPTNGPSEGVKSFASKKLVVILSAVAGACLLLCCGGIGVLVTIFSMEKQAVQQELADADVLWKSGDKAAAVKKYRAILQSGSKKAILQGEEKALAYGRVIDFDMERGNVEAAKQMLTEAVSNQVTPTVNHPEAKVVLASAQKEQLAQAEEQQFRWQQPEGWWGDVLKSSDLKFSPMPGADYSELVNTLNDKKPEKVAKALQHVDPHALFTRDDLKVMARPYYGIQLWTGDVLDANHPDPYTEVQSKSGRKDKFREPLFLVSGDPDQNIGGIVSGTFHRSFELKEERRTKFIQKAVAVKIDFNYTGPDLKKTGIKAARLDWLMIRIPAIFNDEGCYGWDISITHYNNRVTNVRCTERRAEKFGIMADPKIGPADMDLYRIKYDLDDPARSYTIEKLVPKMETIKGR